MHTDKYGGFTVHHNGDFSGDVIIDVPRDARRDESSPRPRVVMTTALAPAPLDTQAVWQVALPFQVFKEMVAAWVADELMSRLETASPDEILRGLR